MNRSVISLGIALGLVSGAAYADFSTWQDAEKVFNTYEKSEKLLPVSAYMSNWGVYGRKFDVQDIVGKYDKIIYSFVGLCGTEIGDPTVTSAVTAIKANCKKANKENFEIAFTDLNSDINNDFGAGANWNATFYTGQEQAGGIIGVLRDAKAVDPDLELALSVGGWSLSEPFSRMAESKSFRTTFINSVIEWFQLYPMFDQIDIDWEYPGGGGAELNSWSEKDGDNYLLLVKELRAALDKNGLSHKKIAIAAAAPRNKLIASNLNALINNGVDYIHLMTYDFMGEWQNKLAHHTNLSGSLSYIEDGEEAFNSAESSIDFMINVLGIPSEAILIGYAGYSRNAGSVELESVSPLVGSFTPGTSTHDSLEEGVAELFDYQKKLVDYSAAGVQGLQGFELYTDTDANADFLYNDQTKQFLSIDTPRSVYAKAQFAKQNNLGGIFAWMADHDPGYHINAAREGLGYKAVSTHLDMSEIVKSCGFIDTMNGTLSEKECRNLSDLTASDLSEASAEVKNGNLVVTVDEELFNSDHHVMIRHNMQLIAEFMKGKLYHASASKKDGFVSILTKQLGMTVGSEIIIEIRDARPGVSTTQVFEKKTLLKVEERLDEVTAQSKNGKLFFTIDEELFNSGYRVQLRNDKQLVGEFMSGKLYHSTVASRKDGKVQIRARDIGRIGEVVAEVRMAQPGSSSRKLLESKILTLD